MKTDNTFYMDVVMVSEYLHVAKSTIYKWAEQQYIPHKKLGKRVIFVRDHIDQWVLNNGIIVKDLPEVPQFKVTVKDPPKRKCNNSYNHGNFPLRA